MGNLRLCHWSSQSFDLRVQASIDVPVLLLNQPIAARRVKLAMLRVLPPTNEMLLQKVDSSSTFCKKIFTSNAFYRLRARLSHKL